MKKKEFINNRYVRIKDIDTLLKQKCVYTEYEYECGVGYYRHDLAEVMRWHFQTVINELKSKEKYDGLYRIIGKRSWKD